MTCVKGRLTPHSPSMATRQHGQLEFLPRHCWRQDLQKVWPWRHAMRASQITSSQIAQQYGVSTGSRKSARSQPMILDRRAGQTQQKTGEPRKSCVGGGWRPKVGYISQRSADLGSGSVKCGASVRDKMYLSFRHLIFLGDRSRRELKFLRAPIAPVTAERAERNSTTIHATPAASATPISARPPHRDLYKDIRLLDPPLISHTHVDRHHAHPSRKP